jgi:hypothetical protein
MGIFFIFTEPKIGKVNNTEDYCQCLVSQVVFSVTFCGLHRKQEQHEICDEWHKNEQKPPNGLFDNF